MNKYLLLFLLFNAFSTCAQAQIVLTPPNVAGSAKYAYSYTYIKQFNLLTCDCGSFYNKMTIGPSTTLNLSDMMEVYHFNVHYSNPSTISPYCFPSDPCYFSANVYLIFEKYHLIGNKQVILEFDISSLIGLGVTPQNYQSATLNHLMVIDSFLTGEQLSLDIYDLEDSSEDGMLTVSDYSNFNSWITNLFQYVPPIGTMYDNIDVTNVIYNDLFGPGNSEDYSGFILYNSTEWTNWYLTRPSVSFDQSEPFLEITIDQPVPSLTWFGLLILCMAYSCYVWLRLR